MAKAKAGKKAKSAGKSKARAASKARAPKKAVARKPKKKVSYVPKGMNGVNAHIWVKDAAKALDFYKRALGAVVGPVMPGPGGKGVIHAEFRVAGTALMIADEWPGMHQKAPESVGATTAGLYCYVPNADALFDRAVKAGAAVVNPLVTMFWGDRMGTVKDPFGHIWTLSTHVEDVPPAEMRKRHEAFMAEMASQGGMGS